MFPDYADLFAPPGMGRPSIPATQMATVMTLQTPCDSPAGRLPRRSGSMCAGRWRSALRRECRSCWRGWRWCFRALQADEVWQARSRWTPACTRSGDRRGRHRGVAAPGVLPRPALPSAEEFERVSEAAGRAGLARGAFAAGVTVAAARGTSAKAASPRAGCLGETDVRSRAGAAHWHKCESGGRPSECDWAARRRLAPAADFRMRVIRVWMRRRITCWLRGAWRSGRVSCRMLL